MARGPEPPKNLEADEKAGWRAAKSGDGVRGWLLRVSWERFQAKQAREDADRVARELAEAIDYIEDEEVAESARDLLIARKGWQG